MAVAPGSAAAKEFFLTAAALRRRIIFSHPLLDFDRLLLIRRTPKGGPRRPEGNDRGLGEFIGELHADLHEGKPWRTVLSGGQKQRTALARAVGGALLDIITMVVMVAVAGGGIRYAQPASA